MTAATLQLTDVRRMMDSLSPMQRAALAGELTNETFERWVSKVALCGECWEWTAHCDRYGYGRFGFKGKNRLAHRVGYEMLVGPIPDGATLDHLCRNRACVNPAHLDPVSLRENIMRGAGVGVRNATRTHCPKGHEYTPENTYVSPKRRNRNCRICTRAATKAWREKTRGLA